MANTLNEDGELKEQACKIIVGAMERGNMYDGYVASAEFNAEAHKVVETYWPMLEQLISTHTAREKIKREILVHDEYWHMQKLVAKEGIGPIALANREAAQLALAQLSPRKEED